MTLKKWGYLFWTTLAWGSVIAVAASIFLVMLFDDFSFLEMTEPGFNWQTLIFALLGGALISTVSQTGFFAYLTVRYIAVGIIRSKWVWEGLQLFLVADALFLTAYLSYTTFAEEGTSWVPYIWLPLILLAVSLIVSYWKMKRTNKNAFIPTLFFMVVVTLIEMLPVLRYDSVAANIYMMGTLIVCNTWQIMILHKLVGNKKELA
ncbi:KinB-signaling pathway activation protein [Paenibacillus sp. MBLB4367]|uniref:KinB-signaling pathway activation protein n=1 Tax=Paenibacillus sp. MBLB4367 TaxID=3384767 RepID=UPI0039083934